MADWLGLPCGKTKGDGALMVTKAGLTTSPLKIGTEVGEAHHLLWQALEDPSENSPQPHPPAQIITFTKMTPDLGQKPREKGGDLQETEGHGSTYLPDSYESIGMAVHQPVLQHPLVL